MSQLYANKEKKYQAANIVYFSNNAWPYVIEERQLRRSLFQQFENFISNALTFVCMKLHFWSVGKAHEPYVKQGIEDFTRRIGHYYPVEWSLIPIPKHTAMLSAADLKRREGELILSWLQPADYLVALDERGKQLSSEGLAQFIGKRSNESVRNLVFLIGGAYGLDAAVLQRANYTWSLSQLVFPHQLVRLLLAEQVYRACTILRNEKYHHS